MNRQQELDSTTPVLSVQGLSYAFDGGTPLLRELSFSVGKGDFISFLAPSGVGKTTLFRLLAGLLEPQAGTITVSSFDDGGTTSSEASRLGRVGYMPQRDSLMPWRTVLDNAALGLELAGTTKREARRRVMELLPSFGLEGTEGKYPHELSGGMRQRVSFLRTLLTGSSLLLLDEPFSALDAMTRVTMQEWLLDVWEQHRKTVLFITHDVEEALLLSDRVLIAGKAPVSQLEELKVELPRPRSYSLTLEPEFIALKKQAYELLGRQSVYVLREGGVPHGSTT